MLIRLEVRDLTRIIQLSSVVSLVMDDPEEVNPDVLVSHLSLITVYITKFYRSAYCFLPRLVPVLVHLCNVDSSLSQQARLCIKSVESWPNFWCFLEIGTVISATN